jgi:hypothetical protein
MALHTGTTGPLIRANLANNAPNTQEPESLRQIHQMLVRVPGIVASGDFLVTQTGTPSRAVSVAAGFAFVPGTNSSPAQGAYHVYNDAAVTVSITAADPTNPRIDVICVTVPDAYYLGASNTPILQAIAGTPAGSPSAPAIPANSLALANVAVAANATTIVNANITDGRVKFLPGGAMGRLGGSFLTADQSPIGAATVNVTSLSTVVTTVGTRRLRVTLEMPWLVVGTTACPVGFVSLLENGTIVAQAGFSCPVSGYGNAEITTERTPSAGTWTYAAQITFGAGTANSIHAAATIPSSLFVDDVGAA